MAAGFRGVWLKGAPLSRLVVVIDRVSDEEEGLFTNWSILKFRLLTIAAEAFDELPLLLRSSANV